jgi:streptogramin lyase
MRTGSLFTAALFALALSACGGGGGGGSTPPAPGPAATPPPAPAFSSLSIGLGNNARGIPIDQERMSLAVIADGSVAFTDGFEWAIVTAPSPVVGVAFGANGGPSTYGRGADGARYSGWIDLSGNAPGSTVYREGAAPSPLQWSYPSAPVAIIAGPDAATWVLTLEAMVRLNADGTTTALPLASGPVLPVDVALGSDGAFWVTEDEGYVERVPLQGPTQRIAVGGRPSRAATGPDALVWFLDRNGLVRRITAAGSVSTVAVIAGGFSVGDAIAAGRDGALWATHAASNELLRIAPDGSTARYPVPGTGTVPTGIGAAPDGSLYFVEETQGGLLLVHAVPH